MLTTGSFIFFCEREIAREVAEDYANLRLIPYTNGYDQWEDRATGGGGCRLTWVHGVTWISRHGGYPQADITAEVSEFLERLGAKPATGNLADRLRPCSPHYEGLHKAEHRLRTVLGEW